MNWRRLSTHRLPQPGSIHEVRPALYSPLYAEDPNRRPGGARWYRDRPDDDKIRADVLEYLAVMLWEEMMYLREGAEPQGTGIPRGARLQNIVANTSQYASWTMKDLRPRELWDQPLSLV